MNRIVPEATFKRRRDRLSTAESERTERIARVVADAEYVWDDRDDARRFLTSPHPALRHKTPIDAAMSELGARQVEEILAKIFYGIPAYTARRAYRIADQRHKIFDGEGAGDLRWPLELAGATHYLRG